jgi:hypothetical protein
VHGRWEKEARCVRRVVERGPGQRQDPGAAALGRAAQDRGIEGWGGAMLTCAPRAIVPGGGKI